MNLKLVLGVFIPALVIIILIGLSSADIEFSVEKETINSVELGPLISTQYHPKSQVPIQTITVSNDFFMPRKFELPKLVACLNDKEGAKQMQDLQVKYNEGTYSRGSDIPFFDDIFYDYRYDSRRSIELSANSKKQVKVFVVPKYSYNYQDISSYKEYDEILLIQLKDRRRYYYNICSGLESKELENAIHINIIGKDKLPGDGGDLFECDRLYGTQKESCISRIATETGNTDYCELILTPTYKYSCYSGIAVTYGNLSVCDRIKETAGGNHREFCIANTAKILKDKSVCSRIQDESARVYCLRITA
jgi:hypothetical protein